MHNQQTSHQLRDDSNTIDLLDRTHPVADAAMVGRVAGRRVARSHADARPRVARRVIL